MLLYLSADLTFDYEINLIPEVICKVARIRSVVDIKSLRQTQTQRKENENRRDFVEAL